jgi:kynurenine formamidase
MNRFIDLTHTFDDHMPVYPGDPEAQLYPTADINSDGYNEFKIESGMHVGTHIDAPLHMMPEGRRISEIDVNSFIAEGHLIDARNQNPFPAELIDFNQIKPGDIVLVFTGFGHKFGQPNYYQKYPEFSLEFAHRLVKAKIAAVGMDTPGPDGPPFPAHNVLLAENILIIENLTNLDKLLDVSRFRVLAFPLKLKADAAPARVIAEVLD